MYGELGSISAAFLKYFCICGSFPSWSAICPATWYSIRAFVVFWAFSYSSAFCMWVSIPSLTMESGFSRRARLIASRSSLLPPHSSSSRVLGSAFGAACVSFLVSVVSFCFLLKNPSSGMGFFMFDWDKNVTAWLLGEKSLSEWVSISAERVTVFVCVSEEVFY